MLFPTLLYINGACVLTYIAIQTVYIIGLDTVVVVECSSPKCVYIGASSLEYKVLVWLS